MQSIQDIIFNLQKYWIQKGCTILQPIDMEVGAGTFHPSTFFSCIGSKHCKFAYVQPSRRPTDGRYGSNPNRTQHYFQFQVIMKPSPENIQDLYMNSLNNLGINTLHNEIRFLEDNWKSPTLGANGLGWEVWINGMEISQITYFQRMGGIDCNPVSLEVTYGIERLAMHLQDIYSIYDLVWDKDNIYRDLFYEHEYQMSKYNFEEADVSNLLSEFEYLESKSNVLIQKKLEIPAYFFLIRASHNFNILEARNSISVPERQSLVLRIRLLAKKIASLRYNKEINKIP